MSKGIEAELECLGFWGFGGGYAIAREGQQGQELYCSGCPLSQQCWEKHKARTADMYPAMVASFEALAAECAGDSKRLMSEWWSHVGNADPYTVVMGGNVEDGMSVANCGCIVDRGPGTLPLPYPAVKRPKSPPRSEPN